MTRSERTRLAGALLLAAASAGCATACDGSALFAAAERGELAAIHEMGELGDPRVPSSRLRVRSIREAYPVLLPHLTDEDPEVRLVATEAVRRLATRRPDLYRVYGEEALDARLSDPDPRIRWRAAWALGRIGRARPALHAAAADPDERVAERAVWALGRARDEAALPVLLAALGRGGRIEAQAALALRRITGLPLPDAAAWRRWARERGGGQDPAGSPGQGG